MPVTISNHRLLPTEGGEGKAGEKRPSRSICDNRVYIELQVR